MDFTGKTVLVTGASRGIGRAVALAFKELGATVIGTATSESGAEAVSAVLAGSGKGSECGGSCLLRGLYQGRDRGVWRSGHSDKQCRNHP